MFAYWYSFVIAILTILWSQIHKQLVVVDYFLSIFLLWADATNIPKDFQGNFLTYKRNKRALKLISCSQVADTWFWPRAIFISVNSEAKCYSIDISEEDINPHCFAYERAFNGIYGTRVHMSLQLSPNYVKVDENEFNLIEKYVCTAYDSTTNN